MELVNRSNPWGVFMSLLRDPCICGARKVLYLNRNHSLNLRARLREGTNNYVEIMALKLLLLLSIEKGTQMF